MMKKTHPPGLKLGRGMWIATWVIALALLTLFFAEEESRWFNPNQDPQTRTTQEGVKEVVLQANRQGHYVATGAINNLPADFLLDTGATTVALSEDLAIFYGLNKGKAGFASTANGTTRIYLTHIERLQIGDIVLYDVSASINPGMDDFILLGMSALKQVELIQRDNLLTLRY